MAERRHQSEIVIAALILLGALALIGSVMTQTFSPPRPVQAIIWFLAAFTGAFVARRVLADLDLGETVIAAVMMTLIITGIRYSQTRTLDFELVFPIGVAIAGAMAGAYSSKRRHRMRVGWLIAAIATGGFGPAVLAVAIVGFTDLGYERSAVILGSLIGCATLTAFVRELAWWHCGTGTAIAYAVLLGSIGMEDFPRPLAALIGAAIGFAVGMFGAIPGTLIWRWRKPKRARVRS